jgi:tRNA pseudouridine55 synthase
MIDGVINLDKPTGITSAKALYRVRRITGVRKSGHAGTLDPTASGVLVICLGRATKLVEAIMDQPKVYRAAARFDVTSPSHDSESETTPVHVRQTPDRIDVLGACARFEGRIQQTPPAVSAVKVGGRPAYRLVRRGQTPVLRPRTVSIYWLHVRRYQWPVLEFEMACGRGTYVRSLIRDLGEVLRCGGCLTALERRGVGPFHIEQARTFEGLEALSEIQEVITPLEVVCVRLGRRPIAVPPRPPQPE